MVKKMSFLDLTIAESPDISQVLVPKESNSHPPLPIIFFVPFIDVGGEC